MVKLEGLDVSIGAVSILRNVNMELPTGKFTGLVGRNGAGKTTLMRSIMGILPPRNGSVHFDGVTLDQPPTSAEAICRAAAKEAGQTGANDQYCEALFFLKRAIEAAPELSAAGVRAGVEAMGDGYVPASAFATHFGPGRHDGVAAVRDMAFNKDCSCWQYTGPVVATG